MPYIMQDLVETFQHHHRNDTTGKLPIGEIPHRSGLVSHGPNGNKALWIIFAIMLGSSVIFFAGSLRLNKKNRLFHHITAMITTFAAISYYCMATDIGRTLIRAPGDHAFREVFYARYLDWLITTPLILVDLALLAGLSPMDTILISLADVAMIVTGLIGGLHPDFRYRWGLFAFACLFLLYIIYGLVVPGYEAATKRSANVGRAYLFLSIHTSVMFSAYAVVWALSEGTNYLRSDTEIYTYGALDVLAKVVFGFVLLAAHNSIKEANVSLPEWFVKPTAYQGYGTVPTED